MIPTIQTSAPFAVDSGSSWRGTAFMGVMRILLCLMTVLCLSPLQGLILVLHLPGKAILPFFYHRICIRLLNFKLIVRGSISTTGPTLYVANHSSYLDITVLGATLPGCCFVAKQEVAGWPLFGWLARLQRTVFVNRQARSQAGEQTEILRERLGKGDSLVLFPEGTSSDGTRTLPFKSALFAIAQTRIHGRPLTVQPISVTAVALDGIPLGRALRPFYAWYGDMVLLPHLWDIFRMGGMTVVLDFHSPVTLEEFGSRKTLAEHCQKVVAQGVAAAVSGRRHSGDAVMAETCPAFGLLACSLNFQDIRGIFDGFDFESEVYSGDPDAPYFSC